MLMTCDKLPHQMTRQELRAEILATTARLAALDRAILRPGIGPATLAILAEGRIDLVLYRATLQAILADMG